MIKILNEPESQEKFWGSCECGVELEYTSSDRTTNEFGDSGVVCPRCGKFIVDEYKKPFEFPRAFYHVDENAIKLTNDKTQEMINNCVNELDLSQDWDFTFNATGDTLVFAFYSKTDGNIEVYVAKNYYSASKYM